jgi:hypothetical protein
MAAVERLHRVTVRYGENSRMAGDGRSETLVTVAIDPDRSFDVPRRGYCVTLRSYLACTLPVLGRRQWRLRHGECNGVDE